MPTYKAPGVYVEETKRPAHPIEQHDAGTTVFIGMTIWGATDIAPPLLTSFGAFQDLYGPCADLRLGDAASLNYVAYAAQAFFENGGCRLHVARVIGSGAKTARWAVADGTVTLTARAPSGALLRGDPGNFKVTFTVARAPLTKAAALRQPVGTLIDTSTASCVIDTPGTDPSLAVLGDSAMVSRVSLGVRIEAPGKVIRLYDDLAFDARHPRAIHTILGNDDPAGEMLVRIGIDPAVGAAALRDVLEAMDTIALTGGSDGDDQPAQGDWAAAMDRARALDGVSIVAAPGSSSFAGDTPALTAEALIALAAQPGGHPFAVLDPPPTLSPDQVLQFAQPYDSKDAALYYPWMLVAGPDAGSSVAVPPSGFVCGIYGRTEHERGVWTSPANEIVRLATAPATSVSAPQQETLAVKGINCIRAFPGRGILVWGARTLSSDPEWKYVARRRYVQMIVRSVERGTAWAVFELNGPSLWTALAGSVADFLALQWRAGALAGAKESAAFFVRCDRTTTSQHDIDQGRAVILIGLALAKPAEYTIVRIVIATGTPAA